MVVLVVAEAYGLSMLPAYLDLTKAQDIGYGVNFVVTGAIALEMDYFTQKRLALPSTTNSLSFLNQSS